MEPSGSQTQPTLQTRYDVEHLHSILCSCLCMLNLRRGTWYTNSPPRHHRRNRNPCQQGCLRNLPLGLPVAQPLVAQLRHKATSYKLWVLYIDYGQSGHVVKGSLPQGSGFAYSWSQYYTYWEHHIQGFKGKPQLGEYVWRFVPGGPPARVMADGFERPNGLALSPDQLTMYVSDTGLDGGADDQVRISPDLSAGPREAILSPLCQAFWSGSHLGSCAKLELGKADVIPV